MWLVSYLTGVLILFVTVAYGYKHNTDMQQIPQWISVLACFLWPITLVILLWSIVFDKPKKS